MRLKKFFKRIGFVLIGLVIGAGVWLGYYCYQQAPIVSDLIHKTEKNKERPLWVADKPAPKTIEPGAYLSALNAILNDDLERAAQLYLKTLKGDMDNEKLQREAYFFNAIMGNFEVLRPIVAKMSPQHRVVFLTDYVNAGYAIHDKNWAQVRENIKNRKPLPLDEIVNPLLTAWSYVGENKLTEAVNALEPLKKQKGLMSYYYYHQGLMALTLGNSFMAEEAFQNLATEKLLTVSFYPEIRDFFVRKGNWRMENPFYVQWQLFASTQPATAELIMQRPSKEMTPTRGMAEAFYNISTAMGSSKNSYEGALILSALSLYLNPDQDLPKIWNAELLEQTGKPQLAAHYYKQLKGPLTQTVEFKKASNMITCGHEEEALPILQQLKRTNRNSTPLWLALANVYQKLKNWPAAVRAYTRVLEIEGETNRTYASDIYFARSFIYSQQKQDTLAESDLKKALELNPENPALLNHLGYQWLEQDNMLEKGFELVEKAYKLRSTDPHIIDSMAYAYYRKAEYQKALPLAEKTVDIMPQSSVANAHLGDIYKALGRHREAVFQYRKALALKYDLTPELKEELSGKIAQNGASSAK